ncbi:nitronate monooxygenase [Azospirillum lipoferum]|uniref:Nitronate monooxygenase n=1 Tax=Azospirillum lipoferum TaxID=193 RepID=A0A5A9GRZ2_AZOLI|nr:MULTISPECIES: nitronate monooxygenase [Azospirillum]KAA0597123.1 nitronate monooxygenase [Azospirillum lipoferum]MCP1608620.1 nitronate monooxygenase [Azospirillum lipoferum]MDW5536062.1 nitronate monooxygenase [Azospirillum sp. NL1]
MPSHTDSLERLGLRSPVIQAPMAGGGDTAALVAAVNEAGGLGFVGAAYLTEAQIAERAHDIRSRTALPFGINLFAPTPAPGPAPMMAEAMARVAGFHAELGLPKAEEPTYAGDGFDRQIAAVLDSGAAFYSVTFGLPPAESVTAAKARGMRVLGTATTVAEAVALEQVGVDAVIAQGSEAGGHRGSFIGDPAANLVGTMALVPQVADAVGVPVIASGGIMDGRGIAAALALGATAVQMGTVFLTTGEAGIPEAHKAAILAAREDQTRITRAFSGRPARGILNRFMEVVEDPNAPDAVLPFPLQNALTRPLRTAAGKAERAEFLSLWAGQGLRLAQRRPAGDLVAELLHGTEAVRRGLAG